METRVPLLRQVLFGVNQRLRIEDVDSPLIQIRPVKTCLVAVVTGDRGLCGGYNNFVIKKARPPQSSHRASCALAKSSVAVQLQRCSSSAWHGGCKVTCAQEKQATACRMCCITASVVPSLTFAHCIRSSSCGETTSAHERRFGADSSVYAMQAEARVKELMNMKVGVQIVTIGKKAATYFKCILPSPALPALTLMGSCCRFGLVSQPACLSSRPSV